MTRSSIHEYADAVRLRYRVAVRKERSRLLDEFCQTTGYHRKAAVRLLGRKAARGARGAGRPRQYDGAVAAALEQVWLASNTVCSKRLSPFMGELIESLEWHGELTVTTAVRAQLLQLSAATIDRLLAPVRQRHHRLPRPPSRPFLKRRPEPVSRQSGALVRIVSLDSLEMRASGAKGKVQGTPSLSCSSLPLRRSRWRTRRMVLRQPSGPDSSVSRCRMGSRGTSTWTTPTYA